MREQRNRSELVNSLKAEIKAKEQRITSLKAKLDARKVEQAAPVQEPMLAKIADEINEIKEIVSGKKEPQDVDADFTPMENVESDSEEEMSQKVEEWRKLKGEASREKREIRAVQEEIAGRKDKWRSALNYLKSNIGEDVDSRKKQLMDEKTEIDMQIKAVNKKVEINKHKAQRVKEMEVELRPYLDKKRQRGSLRKLLSFEDKAGHDALFSRPQNFDDFESMGFSSDQDQ